MKPIDWPRPLKFRRGARHRLKLLPIYYDFDWTDVFGHNRSMFPNGQSLAQLVREECPKNKSPALLLTARDDVKARMEETEKEYIAILPVKQYLHRSAADAASTFYARASDASLTHLLSLADVSFSASELQSFLDEHLDRAALTSWVGESKDRIALLQELAADTEIVGPGHVAQLLRRLKTIDLTLLDEIAGCLDRIEGHGIRELLHRLTQTRLGRVTTAHVIGERLTERISDARQQLAAYQRLIGSEGVTETDVQRFIEDNQWLVGLPYVGTRSRVLIPRGEIDFVLDRYDGFFDILELKGPDEPIIVERQSKARGNRPPSPSAYELGSGLSNALAQAHHYRSILEQSRELADQYGLLDTRQPRILILAGRSSDLSGSAEEILRQLNLTLHRVEVIPYDLLGARTAALLHSIETLLVEQTPDH